MKECNSLAEVRDEIDQLDDQIVELIAKRNKYIKQAARFKNTIDEVKAPDRIDAVIQRLRRKALDLDLSPNLVADLYKLMIDEMVETEIAELRNAKDL
ncbi:chorismate mutase [Sulfurimonas sp. HSL-3221]|uniref:chorismate mutase n=1 Tax=Sulfurimonas diazotrophicus TaxID=3131939 RepID=A0ABZ3H792_9BACT|nr:chorismate mutase [Sulfurimonas sp. HSL-3221]UFS61428.1 chorismate mutase [Sulfurimonas sp. HSL-3221]